MPIVLVVDDEQPILDLVRFTLEDEQVRVVEAADGLEALEAAREHHPEIIFLDVQIPRLDGFEVCRRLRDEPEFDKTKIVMLTAASQEADRARGGEAGADDYLTKPFSPIRLLSIVQSLLPGTVLWPVK